MIFGLVWLRFWFGFGSVRFGFCLVLVWVLVLVWFWFWCGLGLGLGLGLGFSFGLVSCLAQTQQIGAPFQNAGNDPSKSEHPSKMQETTPANRSILPKCRKRPQQIGAPCQTAGNDLSKSESKRAESLKSKHLGMADSRLSCSLSMHPCCEQSWFEIQLELQSRKLGPAWWMRAPLHGPSRKPLQRKVQSR